VERYSPRPELEQAGRCLHSAKAEPDPVDVEPPITLFANPYHMGIDRWLSCFENLIFDVFQDELCAKHCIQSAPRSGLEQGDEIGFGFY
jgi:hypothetical protein